MTNHLNSLNKNIQLALKKYLFSKDATLIAAVIDHNIDINNSFISAPHSIKLTTERGNVTLIIKQFNPNSKNNHPDTYFYWECYTYRNILPALVNLQTEFNLTKLNFAKCIDAKSDPMEEYLILEDLRDKQYKTASREEQLRKPEMLLTLDVLAKFHATCFALKEYKRGVFNEFTREMKERFLKIQPWFENVFHRSFEKMINLVGDSESRVLLGLKSELFLTFEQLTLPNSAGQFSVIGHGDLWTGNILFKYENCIPIGCIFIDWQLVRHHSPTLDLMHLLFTSSNQELRNLRTAYELISHYHESLKMCLKTFNLNFNDMFPETILFDHLRKFACLGLAIGIVSLPLHARTADDAMNLERLLQGKDILELSEKSEHNFKSMSLFMLEFICDLLSRNSENV